MWKEFEASNRLENRFCRVSSALYGEAKKSEPRSANVKWSHPCVFSLRATNITLEIPLSFDLLLPRITQLYYSTFHNFWKLKSFINAVLGLVLKYVKSMWLKYIAFEGKRCVNCFVSWRMLLALFFSVCLLRHQWKANNWFSLFFAGLNLQAGKQNCCCCCCWW